MDNPPPPPAPPANLPPPAGYAPQAYAAPIPIPPPVYAPPPMGGEQVRYAGFWIRLVAAFLDGIFVGLVIRLVFFVIGLITVTSAIGTGTQTLDTTSTAVSVLIYLIYFVFYAGYYVYFWGMGQTPAQRIFHIYVADAQTGTAIGFGRAGLRLLGYVLSCLACYVGLIWAAFDPRKQGWHDKIASTVVFYGG